MKQGEYLTAIKKQQSLIRKLFANKKRRQECINEITRERYGHLVGKFFKADGKDNGTTYFIAAVHGNVKDDATDEVIVSLECRYIMRSATAQGIRIGCDDTYDNISFFTKIFCYSVDDDIDNILAPLYIADKKAAKEVSEIYNGFIDKFLKKG